MLFAYWQLHPKRWIRRYDTRLIELFEAFRACWLLVRQTEKNMKIALNIVGALLVILGSIWFLQGINVLPGSFMTGQIRWAIYGGIAVIAGIGVLLWANRKRQRG